MWFLFFLSKYYFGHNCFEFYFFKKARKKFAGLQKSINFAVAFGEMHLTFVGFHAEIAQLVEHNLAKVGVAGPSPVFRSHSGQSQ